MMMTKVILSVIGIIVFSYFGFFIYSNFQDSSKAKEVLDKYWELAFDDKIEEANQLTSSKTKETPPSTTRTDGINDCCFQERISPEKIKIVSIEKTEIYKDNVGVEFMVLIDGEEVPYVIAPTIAMEIIVEGKYFKKKNLGACFGRNIKDDLWQIRKINSKDDSETLKDICFKPL